MKKIIVLFGLLILCSSLYAQKISINGHLGTNFENVIPALGLEVNLSKIDILAGISFWYYNTEVSYNDYQTYNTDNTLDEYWLRFFAGIAPKLIATEKWSLSFPLLAKIQFRNDSLVYKDDSVYTSSSPKEVEYFGYGFDAGTRLYYALTQRWSIYLGAMANVLYIADNKYTFWNSSAYKTYSRENKSMSFFTDGVVELGVRFTF
jgi:hypothetical protein